MRIAVFGTGGVGAYFGARLAEALDFAIAAGVRKASQAVAV